MKTIKAILLYFIVAVFAVSFTACGKITVDNEDPATDGSEQGKSEITAYDDKNVYTANGLNVEDYDWDDSDGVLNGEFSDGATYKGFTNFTENDISVQIKDDDSKLRKLTGKELREDKNVTDSIKSGFIGRDAENTVYDIKEAAEFVEFKIKNTNKADLKIVPSFNENDAEESDCLKFYCAMNHSFGGENKDVYLTLYAFGFKVLNIYRNTWYEIKISLSAYEYPINGIKYSSKTQLLNAFADNAMLSFASSESADSAKNDFTVYISKPILMVEKIYDAGGRSFTDMTERASYNGKELAVNSYIFWGNTAVERRADENGIIRSMLKYSYANADGGNIAVKPLKKVEQIRKYDYLSVVMYIKTENPQPIQIGYNGSYNVKNKKVSHNLSNDVPTGSILVSANKWVVLKIPVEYIIAAYARMQNNRIYTVYGVSYVYYNNICTLFYINGDFVDGYTDSDYDKAAVYGYDVYVSRMILEKTK